MRALLGSLIAVLAATAAPAQVRLLGAAEIAHAPAAESTVLEVLSVAKIALNADLANVVVLRLHQGEALAIRVDCRAMLARGDTTSNVKLDAGDVVFVPAGSATLAGGAGAIDAAIEAVAARGDVADRAQVLCLRALHADEPGDRALAVHELCETGPDAAGVLPTLRRALRDTDVTVVREAVTALGVLGPAAREAADDLGRLRDHADAQVRARARAAWPRVVGD